MEPSKQSHAEAAAKLGALVDSIQNSARNLQVFAAVQKQRWEEKRDEMSWHEADSVYRIVLQAQMCDILDSLKAIRARVASMDENVRCMQMAQLMHKRAHAIDWSSGPAAAGVASTVAKEGTRLGVEEPSPALPPLMTEARGLMYSALATAEMPKPSDT